MWAVYYSELRCFEKFRNNWKKSKKWTCMKTIDPLSSVSDRYFKIHMVAVDSSKWAKTKADRKCISNLRILFDKKMWQRCKTIFYEMKTNRIFRIYLPRQFTDIDTARILVTSIVWCATESLCANCSVYRLDFQVSLKKMFK